MRAAASEVSVAIPVDAVVLEGTLALPAEARGVVLFAHGSGSSRRSPRNSYVARALFADGLGTLLTDLLTEEEDASPAARFDIDALSHRLVRITSWLRAQPAARDLGIGYFGASTGAAAALQAAALLGPEISAVVSRGGRPDLAAAVLPRVTAPTLLIVGGLDEEVLRLNQAACARLRALTELCVVPGASHLFEEPGALDEVARLAADWFERHLAAPRRNALGRS